MLNGEIRRGAYRTMARWIADDARFPARAFREWVIWMFKEDRLVRGRLWLGGWAVGLSGIDQGLLIVMAGADHVAPREGTRPLLGLVWSQDITRVERPGIHVGLMAGSGARKGIWPEISAWLCGRSQTTRRERRNGSSSGP